MSTMRNSVMLIGHPTAPVMNSEEKQASFKLAVADKANECFYTFDCVALDEKSTMVVRQVKQGVMTAIEGSLRNHNYTDREGYTHTHTEVVICDVLPLEKAKTKEAAQ